MRVLILGASGMLGHAAFQVLSGMSGLKVLGASRSAVDLGEGSRARLLSGVDALQPDDLHRAFAWARPEVVVNAVGLVKQLENAADPLVTVPVNTLLPHRLKLLCGVAGARLVHVSTDCVFTGSKGGYTEEDVTDALDLYGVSKRLGEVDAPHAITLRTSIIGRELRTRHGLVEWFLNAGPAVAGFRQAVFSGLTTVELARVIGEFVIPRPELSGVHHVSVEPINKFDLLKLLNQAYGLDRTITPDDKLVIDRSLNSDRFRAATGYQPPAWPDMLARMRALQG
jgi:dTDP-4-dehydrorhamnose reductase